jgi:hypothetical protein
MHPLLYEFFNVFIPSKGLSPIHPIHHSIDLELEDSLLNSPTYKLPPYVVVEIKHQIKTLLEFNRIEPLSPLMASQHPLFPKRTLENGI